MIWTYDGTKDQSKFSLAAVLSKGYTIVAYECYKGEIVKAFLTPKPRP